MSVVPERYGNVRSNRRNNRVPNGWLGCPNNGNKLIVDKFMPLKTPLSTHFDRQLKEDERFHPDEIFRLAEQNEFKFGLWIDLCNTDRYYDRREIEQLGCRYEKMSCQGHGTCPTSQDVYNFIKIVDKFVKNHPKDCIAVHCTHGFNRTGFLIVSFLVEFLKFNVGDALRNFRDFRPPGIYRHEYIHELHKRYGSSTDVPYLPEVPPWTQK